MESKWSINDLRLSGRNGEKSELKELTSGQFKKKIFLDGDENDIDKFNDAIRIVSVLRGRMNRYNKYRRVPRSLSFYLRPYVSMSGIMLAKIMDHLNEEELTKKSFEDYLLTPVEEVDSTLVKEYAYVIYQLENNGCALYKNELWLNIMGKIEIKSLDQGIAYMTQITRTKIRTIEIMNQALRMGLKTTIHDIVKYWSVGGGNGTVMMLYIYGDVKRLIDVISYLKAIGGMVVIQQMNNAIVVEYSNSDFDPNTMLIPGIENYKLDKVSFRYQYPDVMMGHSSQEYTQVLRVTPTKSNYDIRFPVKFPIFIYHSMSYVMTGYINGETDVNVSIITEEQSVDPSFHGQEHCLSNQGIRRVGVRTYSIRTGPVMRIRLDPKWYKSGVIVIRVRIVIDNQSMYREVLL